MKETNRFGNHKPCDKCGFRYGFHICLGLPKRIMDKVVPESPKTRHKLTEEEKQDALEREEQRFEDERQQNEELHKKIVERYSQGGAGYEVLCSEFKISSHKIRKVLKTAADRGEIKLRKPGQKAVGHNTHIPDELIHPSQNEN